MKLCNCPACNGPAGIRYRTDSRRHCFRVWIECGTCRSRTREFIDTQEPGPDTTGGKFAALAWNGGDRQESKAWEG